MRTRTINLLRAYGYVTSDDKPTESLADIPLRELLRMPGIGPDRVAEIAQWVKKELKL